MPSSYITAETTVTGSSWICRAVWLTASLDNASQRIELTASRTSLSTLISEVVPLLRQQVRAEAGVDDDVVRAKMATHAFDGGDQGPIDRTIDEQSAQLALKTGNDVAARRGLGYVVRRAIFIGGGAHRRSWVARGALTFLASSGCRRTSAGD